MKAHLRNAILETVRAIPPGKVSSYGRVAEATDLPGRARLVGKVLGTLGVDDDVPWHRVLNAGGRISFPKDSEAHALQRSLLEEEGVAFVGDRIASSHWWDPYD